MVGLFPFAGSFIKPEFVRRVPAPAFDSMNGIERRVYLDTHPESYALVTRSPGDGGPDDDSPTDRLIELGAEALQRIVSAEAFEQVDAPSFFLYKLERGEHRQIGIVGIVETADYLNGHIKRHEQVSTERAMHLSQHFERLGVQSSPIAFGYRSDPAVRAILDDILDSTDPVVSFVSGDGLEQAVWVVDAERSAALTEAFESHDLYIMDGHHRAAAAAKLYERVGSPRADYMLGVLFADDRVNIDPFHRRVLLAEHVDVTTILQDLTDLLSLVECPECVSELPTEPGEIAVYANHKWWKGSLPAPASDSPLDAIGPVRLQKQVLGPLHGIDPEGSEGRITYFLDDVDRALLAETLSDRELLFVLQAVTPQQVFAVADAGLDMPPKSTYVTPKPRSGVFLRTF